MIVILAMLLSGLMGLYIAIYFHIFGGLWLILISILLIIFVILSINYSINKNYIDSIYIDNINIIIQYRKEKIVIAHEDIMKIYHSYGKYLIILKNNINHDPIYNSNVLPINWYSKKELNNIVREIENVTNKKIIEVPMNKFQHFLLNSKMLYKIEVYIVISLIVVFGIPIALLLLFS